MFGNSKASLKMLASLMSTAQFMVVADDIYPMRAESIHLWQRNLGSSRDCVSFETLEWTYKFDVFREAVGA